MYVNPKAYCHSFKDWEGQPVNIIEQMDVEEYLNMFMDRLENAIKGTPQEKTIQYHFGGSFANEIICKTCPHSYLRTESFLNVGIPVMNKKTLYEGLDAFVKGDMLEERDQYLCEKCDKKVDALKRTCFQTLPRYMIMTLKRFEFDMDRMMRVKLNDYYEFKEEIDVAEYTHEYLSAKEKAQKAPKDGDGEAADSKEELLKTLKQPRAYYQYELVGIVVHSGTADSGHYYSYIKEQEAFKAQGSDKWFEFNDVWVRDFDPSEIPAECYGGEETAYSQSQWGN
jgi:ubiquitin carboxyl-terminal hydrolase 9/24